MPFGSVLNGTSLRDFCIMNPPLILAEAQIGRQLHSFLCGVKKSSLAARRGDHTQILTMKKTLPFDPPGFRGDSMEQCVMTTQRKIASA